MISIRRLSDKTLAKYQAIVAAGGELTHRQKMALEGHALITDRVFVDALLRPDLMTEDKLRARLERSRAALDAANSAVNAATEATRLAHNGDVQPPARPEKDK